MKKRDYPIFLFALLLLVNGVLAQEPSKPRDKDSDKDKEMPMVWSIQPESGPFTLFVGNDAYLGVYLEEVTAEKVKALNLSEERGAIISKVTAGGPAEKAGLKENDVILSFNGRRVDTVRELQRLLGETPGGRNVTFEVIRGGSHQTISVTLGKRGGNMGLFDGHGEVWKGLPGNFGQNPLLDKEFAEKWKSHAEEMAKRSKEWQGRMFANPPNFGNFNFDFNGRGFWRGSRLGVAVESMTDQLAEYFGVKNGKGILVTEVFENSAAAKAGIKAGDIIIEIDNRKVDDPGDLSTALSEKSEGQVELKVVRKGDEKKFTLTLEKVEVRPFTRRRASVPTKSSDTI
jgi:C-terminal processing protease CtpA/Prc